MRPFSPSPSPEGGDKRPPTGVDGLEDLLKRWRGLPQDHHRIEVDAVARRAGVPLPQDPDLDGVGGA
jgi:hypothetical protein